MLYYWAMRSRQSPATTILCVLHRCHGTEMPQSHTGSHSVCAATTPLGVDQKILSITREPIATEWFSHSKCLELLPHVEIYKFSDTLRHWPMWGKEEFWGHRLPGLRLRHFSTTSAVYIWRIVVISQWWSTGSSSKSSWVWFQTTVGFSLPCILPQIT